MRPHGSVQLSVNITSICQLLQVSLAIAKMALHGLDQELPPAGRRVENHTIWDRLYLRTCDKISGAM